MISRLHLLGAFLILLNSHLVSSYAPGGKCGRQFGGAVCSSDQGCCSFDGYCGLSAAYCLVSNGCQANCTDGTPTAIIAPAAAPVTSTVTTTTSAATSASPTADASSGGPVTRNIVIGIIAAVVGLLLIAGAIVYCYKRNKTKASLIAQDKRYQHEKDAENLRHQHEIEREGLRQSAQALNILETWGPSAARALPGNTRRQLTDGGSGLPRSTTPGRVFEDLD